MGGSRHAAAREVGKLPSERNFGFTVGAILLAIACLRVYWHATASAGSMAMIAIAAILIILAALRPVLLRIPNRLWAKLGDVLFVVMNPIVMLAIYITTFVPLGLFLRLTGKDPLRGTFDKSIDSYWIDRAGDVRKTSSMTNQF